MHPLRALVYPLTASVPRLGDGEGGRREHWCLPVSAGWSTMAASRSAAVNSRLARSGTGDPAPPSPWRARLAVGGAHSGSLKGHVPPHPSTKVAPVTHTYNWICMFQGSPNLTKWFSERIIIITSTYCTSLHYFRGSNSTVVHWLQRRSGNMQYYALYTAYMSLTEVLFCSFFFL